MNTGKLFHPELRSRAGTILAACLVVLLAALVVPLSTWFYQLTGKIYLGTLVNGALVTWMSTSSQVIAPIPI